MAKNFGITGIKSDPINLLIFVIAIFWGIGTQFFEVAWISPYLYVIHSISDGDVIFIFTLILSSTNNAWRIRFQETLYQMRYFVGYLVTLVAILLTSEVVNMFVYGNQDLLALMVSLKYIYFLLVAVFVSSHVKRYGLLSILLPFILGLLAIVIEQVYWASTSSEAVILRGGDLTVLRDPNVIGAVLGYGIIFCSLALLQGGKNIYWLLVAFFCYASIYTFSKGSWIMIFLGLAACLAAVRLRMKSIEHSNNKILVGMLVVTLALSYFIYKNFDMLEDAFSFKMESTEEIGSVNERYNLALVGLYGMLEHPLLGVGYRNFDVIGNQYPELVPQNSGNSNNALLQVGVAGGLLPFALIIWIFLYPFKLLFHILPLQTLAGKIYFGAVFAVMSIFAAVQLQLITQPVFWVFIGLISGWKSNINKRAETVVRSYPS